jgi:three-Cys-motif partner protein
MAATAEFGAPTVLNLKGTFAEHLPGILEEIGSSPTLFFLDPFGYRGIEMPTMTRIAKRSPGLKTELLINFNVPKVDRDAGWLDSVGVEPPAPAFVANVNRLMGTDAWLERYEQYAPVADRLRYLTLFYMGELERIFGATAVSYPVRTVSGQLKYYLIFLTRHVAGLLAMSDVIHRVDKEYERQQKDYVQSAAERRAALTGQASLWSPGDLMPATPTDAELDGRITAALTGR